MSLIDIHFENLVNYRANRINIYGTGLCPHQVETYLVNQGFTRGDIDTNGWDVDFRIPYTKDGVTIIHSGSWYYGGSVLEISKK